MILEVGREDRNRGGSFGPAQTALISKRIILNMSGTLFEAIGTT